VVFGSKQKIAAEGVEVEVEEPNQTRVELRALMDIALAAKAAGATDMDHMDGAAAAFNYVRIADLVLSCWRSGRTEAPILDWGCGYGQVSWLLRGRRLPVVSFDVEKRATRELLPLLRSVQVDYVEDPVRLPYRSESFSAVLSVGVLEHVADLHASLREVHRVLLPSGRFFIFMLPNRFSWSEWISDRRHISVHPNKYTFRQTIDILKSHGFLVERKWRRNFLPRNLTGLSQRIKRIYGQCYRQIEWVDRVLANCPPTALFSGVLEMIARKHA
jgi:SAM-dependent methyltransferase